MARRVFVDGIKAGLMALSAEAGHHLRNVLRVQAGTEIELFDGAGHVATAVVVDGSGQEVVVRVGDVVSVEAGGRLTIAAAIPKGDRADWMIEKLSELGVWRFVPLFTHRGVVVPGGRNKIDRWERIAVEAAKQSHRAGVMEIGPLSSVAELLALKVSTWVLSTTEPTQPIAAALGKGMPDVVLVGPEGGWDEGETEMFRAAGLMSVGLTRTILRIETAAIAVAAIVGSLAANK